MRKMKFVSILIIMILFTSSICLAKSEPPAELNEIWEIFGEFEEKFEDGEWDEALKEQKEIAEKFEKVKEVLKINAKVDHTAEFISNLNKLEKSLSGKKREESEEIYIELQKKLFIIMDDYNYKVHPAFVTLGKFISDEAMEAAEQGDFDETVNEMNEVYKISTNITFLYAKRRVSLKGVAAFHAQIEVVKKACESKNKEAVIKELNKLIDSYKSLRLL